MCFIAATPSVDFLSTQVLSDIFQEVWELLLQSNTSWLFQDSLSSVEALLRKHEAFEKTLAAQAGCVEELEQLAIELQTDNHYDTAGITQRLQAVCARRDRLKESATARRKRLQESHQLQQFLRNMYEVRIARWPVLWPCRKRGGERERERVCVHAVCQRERGLFAVLPL